MRPKIRTVTFALVGTLFSAAVATATPLVYFASNAPTDEFGILDLSTGSYSIIGALTGGSGGMTFGPGGNLYSVTLNSDLVTINPATAAESLIRSAIGPAGDVSLGGNSGALFANSRLSPNSTTRVFEYYTVDPTTGVLSDVGPSLTFPHVPGDSIPTVFDNSSGSATEYAYYDVFDATAKSYVINPSLYSLNSSTGAATLIGTTGVDDIEVLVEADGQLYGITSPFIGTSGPSIYLLNTSTGAATFVANVAPGIGHIFGAAAVPAPVPEPATITLTALGLAGVVRRYRRRRVSR